MKDKKKCFLFVLCLHMSRLSLQTALVEHPSKHVAFLMLSPYSAVKEDFRNSGANAVSQSSQQVDKVASLGSPLQVVH